MTSEFFNVDLETIWIWTENVIFDENPSKKAESNRENWTSKSQKPVIFWNRKNKYFQETSAMNKFCSGQTGEEDIGTSSYDAEDHIKAIQVSEIVQFMQNFRK